MALSNERMQQLASQIAARIEELEPSRAKPVFRVIQQPRPTIFDSITRNCILARVRTLTKGYRLQWLVEQFTFNTPGIDSLQDEQLSDLLQQMERARECIADGTSFEDAGLVINTADLLP